MTIPEIQINNSAREDIEREYNPKFSIYHKKLIGVGDVTIFVDVYDDPQKGIPYNIYLDGAFFEGRSILDVENQKVPLKFVMLDITHLIEGNYEGVDPKLRQARGLVRICKIYDSILMLLPQVNAEYYQYSGLINKLYESMYEYEWVNNNVILTALSTEENCLQNRLKRLFSHRTHQNSSCHIVQPFYQEILQHRCQLQIQCLYVFHSLCQASDSQYRIS